MVVVAVGGAYAVPAFLPALQSVFSHETGYPIAADFFSVLAQFDSHAGAAVGLPGLFVDLDDLGAKLLGLLGAFRGLWLEPGVVAAARGTKHRAQRLSGVFTAHRFDLGIPLRGCSERMPSDFFRMSRCSARRRFS